MDARELKICPSCGALPCDWTDDPYAKVSKSKTDARADFIDFLVQYGSRCRDCADENGFCPQTGIGCGQRRKAVEFILGAIEYGAKHGYSAGFTIIHDSENHGPTRDRAAEVAQTWHLQPSMVELDIAAAIRAMEVKP